VYRIIYQRNIALDSLGFRYTFLNKITWLRLLRVVVGLRIKFTPNKMWFLDLTIMIKGCVITHSQDEWMMIG
jgi:hypothetical protein